MYAETTSSYSSYRHFNLKRSTATTGLISVTEDHIVADPGGALAIDPTTGPFANAGALGVLNRA